MDADRVTVSWDNEKSKWLVRIQNGEEVIRRSCNLPKTADDAALRSAALKTLADEGYASSKSQVTIQR